METEEEILFNDYLVREVFPKEGMCKHGNYQKTCRFCNNKNSKIKILCAMSGGVDSSVAAALLKKQGCDVIGVFLKFWSPANIEGCYRGNICCNDEALRSARAVCEKLKIPFYVFDVSKEFKKEVTDYYISEYDSGRTPNPCVVCNKKIKFGWLINKAKKLGCDFVATGHYARLWREILNPKKRCHSEAKPKNLVCAILDPSLSAQDDNKPVVRLFRAKDAKKDQSYFLWQLSQDQLKHVLFPIGGYTKKEVRKMARQWKLPTAQKPESQDICFVPNGDNASFLHQYAKKLNQPGKITDLRGQSLGRHQGLINYTIGQRHGLGSVQLKIPNSNPPGGGQITNKFQNPNYKLIKNNSSFKPAFVIKLNVGKNQLTVGEEKDLYSKTLIAKNINWLAGKPPKFNLTYQSKIRYGAKEAGCKLSVINNQLSVKFVNLQRAITPGQSVVIYKDKELLGGGIVK